MVKKCPKCGQYVEDSFFKQVGNVTIDAARYAGAAFAYIAGGALNHAAGHKAGEAVLEGTKEMHFKTYKCPNPKCRYEFD